MTIAFIALLLVGGGVLWLTRDSGSAAAEMAAPTATVTRGNIEETVSSNGNVVSDQQASLTFQTSGTVVEVLADEGQYVQAGEVLARLDTTTLEWQVARSQASLDTALAQLTKAQEPPSEKEVASAQAALDNARANYEDIKAGALSEEVASAQAALDSARANLRDVQDGPSAEELAAAQASVDSAQAAVAQAQASYDRIKHLPDLQMRSESLNLENATIEYERALANYESVANHPTTSELAAARSQVASAEATLAQLLDRSDESALAAAEAQVSSAEASLDNLLDYANSTDLAVYRAQVEEAQVALDQALSQIEDAALYAPFSGVVLQVPIEEGEWATPGALAVELAATEPMIVAVNVDEVDIDLLKEGQDVHITFDALKDVQIEGTIQYIAPASTNVNGAVAYGMEVSFSPGEHPVRLGMTTDIDVVVARADRALLVPNRAITADREAGRYFVTQRAPDGTEQVVEVEIGLRDSSHTQILSGLEEGDPVVLPVIEGELESGDQFTPPGPAGRQSPMGGN